MITIIQDISTMRDDIRTSDQIPVGMVFEGKTYPSGLYEGLFLRTYSQIVLLNDVRKTWTPPSPTKEKWLIKREVDLEIKIIEKAGQT